MDENNLPGKENEGTQQNQFVKTPTENSKQTGVSLNGEPGKVAQDEGEDSNHAPSVGRYFTKPEMYSFGVLIM